jgi:hypothetical protein
MAGLRPNRVCAHNLGHFVRQHERGLIHPGAFPGGDMRGLGSGAFDPKTLAILEAAFDETWLTLKLNGNDRVRPGELARCILRLANEGELDPARLQEQALSSLAAATTWRQANV